MSPFGVQDLAGAAMGAAQDAGLRLVGVFVAPGSPGSLASLLAALAIGGLFLLMTRRPGKRPVPVKVLVRALMPRRLWASASGRTDIGFFLFNVVLFGGLFGWAIASQAVISGWLLEGMRAGLGEGPGSVIGPVGALIVGTVALFLTGELAYWTIHFLSHRIPWMWEIHKVHHSAEHLSPLTNFRVHPIEGVLFANLLAVMMGTANAVLTWALGEPAGAFTVWDRNVIALAGLYAVQHLQHSHLWITFPGVLGRVVYSPAHHQIHHSTNPAHFGSNLGSLTTLWDWLFGTLYTPDRTKMALEFGLEPGESKHETVMEGMVLPVARAAGLGRRPVGEAEA
ncbi:sterol desaturase family protein [Caulobacter sp. SLTY]|uniref:sterol desaturase family protein n=1 Tax=Caulobacter sp. SLTY TaxID=2683262 RepID=UPI001412C88A|nr:sterol desaturase family protein [Caulobacter sp. SLTY]NBB16491.1 sterol desaturase family protein [Caulobacter sp. SLTY]